ncbi:polyphosphate kinase 2 family protein [Zafaria sp. Z1313]|uniref:polyphosphate kinase 2 family protein n=1 Tax=unclassified Zafaria TaxID=2828765 RepID=UPI002E79964C|nr:polyphosphate kinase 2 family protein [Zafaria sp. J156]MEE1620434.1 polyphosphate kinase 2 family protein [Zafaria sp. J156]
MASTDTDQDGNGSVDFEVGPGRALRVGEGFRLADVDPDSKPGYPGGKAEGQARLAIEDGQLGDLQERLFAASRTGGFTGSVLLVLQAMDTAGKGGIVRHVIGAVDPQGVKHHAFKAPTEEEKRHDFLWRIERELPGPGMIGVFDRSHYEDVLIHRVRGFSSPEEIERRYGAIREFEAGLVAGGTKLVKVMLHLSKDEQRARLAERLERPDKYWKFNPGDIDEREYWDDYMDAYQIAIERTHTEDAPWFVVPADKKWYARIAVQQLLIDALTELDPQWPPADFDVEEQKARLAAS